MEVTSKLKNNKELPWKLNDNLRRKMVNIKHFSLRFAIQNAIKHKDKL